MQVFGKKGDSLRYDLFRIALENNPFLKYLLLAVESMEEYGAYGFPWGFTSAGCGQASTADVYVGWDEFLESFGNAEGDGFGFRCKFFELLFRNIEETAF